MKERLRKPPCAKRKWWNDEMMTFLTLCCFIGVSRDEYRETPFQVSYHVVVVGISVANRDGGFLPCPHDPWIDEALFYGVANRDAIPRRAVTVRFIPSSSSTSTSPIFLQKVWNSSFHHFKFHIIIFTHLRVEGSKSTLIKFYLYYILYIIYI